MYIDTCVGRCTGIHVGSQVQGTHVAFQVLGRRHGFVFGHLYGHVYSHAYVHAYRYAHGHACRHAHRHAHRFRVPWQVRHPSSWHVHGKCMTREAGRCPNRVVVAARHARHACTSRAHARTNAHTGIHACAKHPNATTRDRVSMQTHGYTHAQMRRRAHL